jgi:hypothetical protein
MTIEQAYEDGHSDFEVRDIVYEDDAEFRPEPITVEYTAPAIGVDTSARFSKQEIIGGSTVRQKIGEDPIEVSVSGVCRESTAKKIDALREARFGDIFSQRFPGGVLTVQFASSSTQPFDDAGAVDFNNDDQEFIYTYDLECVEVGVQ